MIPMCWQRGFAVVLLTLIGANPYVRVEALREAVMVGVQMPSESADAARMAILAVIAAQDGTVPGARDARILLKGMSHRGPLTLDDAAAAIAQVPKPTACTGAQSNGFLELRCASLTAAQREQQARRALEILKTIMNESQAVADSDRILFRVADRSFQFSWSVVRRWFDEYDFPAGLSLSTFRPSTEDRAARVVRVLVASHPQPIKDADFPIPDSSY